jgi:dTDP-4-amino-4,6-dideoxygalactose transaminase
MVLNPGDEVIMPSWSHPSAANAVILAGGVPVFVDVNDDLNIEVLAIRVAITSKTKAILPVHYAGVVADMTVINNIADAHGLFVIEDAAQAIGNWKVSGDFGCLSFQEKKNVQIGQGGALIVKNEKFLDRVQVFQNMGTDRHKNPNWDWVGVGSSYLMSEKLAPMLYEQLAMLPHITKARQDQWNVYADNFKEHADKSYYVGNGHLFWLLVEDKLEWINTHQHATTHFDALHMTPPGRKYGRVGGPITRATKAMQKLVKLYTNVQQASAEPGRIQQAA